MYSFRISQSLSVDLTPSLLVPFCLLFYKMPHFQEALYRADDLEKIWTLFYTISSLSRTLSTPRLCAWLLSAYSNDIPQNYLQYVASLLLSLKDKADLSKCLYLSKMKPHCWIQSLEQLCLDYVCQKRPRTDYFLLASSLLWNLNVSKTSCQE